MRKLAMLTTLALAVTAATQTTLPPDVARIHYQRADGTYTGWGLHVWEDTPLQIAWDKPLAISGTDEYGAYWDVKLNQNAAKLAFIVHKGDDKDPGPDMYLDLSKGRELWMKSGSQLVTYAKPGAGVTTVDATVKPAATANTTAAGTTAQAAPSTAAPTTAAAPVPANTVRVNYFRPDGNYAGWGLHAWEDTTAQVEWTKPLPQTGMNDFGAYWDVPMKEGWQKLGFIVHKGDDKDPGPDMFLNAPEGNQVWIVSGTNKMFTEKPDVSVRQVGDLTRMQALWLTRDTLAVKPELIQGGAQVNLHYSRAGKLTLKPGGIEGADGTVPLIPVDGGMTAALKARYPHLAAYAVVRIRPEEANLIPELLRAQTAVSSVSLDDKLVDATGVQTHGVLDALYAYDGPLGVTWQGSAPTLRLWAPTAQDVKLRVYDAPTGEAYRTVTMTRDARGVWSATGDASWKNKYYTYAVTVYSPFTQKVETNVVTDPYSFALSLNSTRSRIVNLSDDAFKPKGWDQLKKPELRSVGDLTLYELHVRDFSVRDTTVPQNLRGTYLAFTAQNSAGMKHLRSLAGAGLRAVHLLPTFDIATINEDRSTWKTPGDLGKLPPNSDQQQAAVNAVRDQDAFNWGYDPFHYTVPEGSYASNPDQRTLEYRQMVMALNAAGLRVIQDVVYNHTNASGQSDKSVLDRIVPGYYHRLNLNGGVENSTCCANTATEHKMMEKLMIDSIVTWAKQYKVDGFRFDLMGHHMLVNMQNVRKALDALTVQKDGVDGKKIYVYGEGWNFGEVENNRRGVNATQINMYGLGMGTFNDRIRDALRGGNPFGGLQDQGFATGLFTIPNGLSQNTDKNRLLQLTDQIRVGLTGNLRDYKLVDAKGSTVTGAQVTYNGAPAGYAASPRESINYASAHDNQTLWDAVLLKAPRAATTAQRVRMHNLATSAVALGQGIPFFHAGDELLRSKSFDNDSYNSGDWFNAIDWTGADNGFGRGLPMQDKNGSNWDLYRQLLGDAKLAVTAADRQRAADHLRDMLAVRASSTLFRMETAQQVQQGLTFLNTGPNQLPGVIVMKLSGKPGQGNPFKDIVVVFNATGQALNYKNAALAGLKLELHPALQKSSDAVVKQAKATSGTLSVPALTTAVFVGK